MKTTKQTNTDSLNRRQLRTYNKVIESVLYHGIYEVKELEVTTFDSNPDVLVYVKTGAPNDEGTLAEVLCRDSYMFHIGKMGGLYTYSDNCNRLYHKTYEVLSLRI